MRRERPVLLLLLLLLPAGCSTRWLQRPVERRVRHRLTSWIGPARHYSVRISRTDDADLVLGRIEAVDVIGEDVLAGGRLQIERFELRLRGIRYTGGHLELLSMEDSTLTADLATDALNEYLARYHAREGVQAAIEDGAVTIRLTMMLLGTPTPIRATGKLAIEGGKRIVFVADRVDAPRAPLFGPGKQLVERQLNPLVDMEVLGVPLRLTDLEVTDGHVRIRGAADLPVEPERRGRRR